MRVLASVAAAAVLAAIIGCGSSRDYIAEGDRLFSLEKYDDAILIYRKAIQKNPKFSPCLLPTGGSLPRKE